MNGRDVPMRVHGSVPPDRRRVLRERGVELLDLSTNIPPYGVPGWLREALQQAVVDCYPDPTASAARRALARACDVDAAQVVVGNGAADLLWTLVRALLGPDDGLLQPEPTFSEPAAAARAVGARVWGLSLLAEDGFVLDLPRLAEAIERHGPHLVYLCTPNNPTGSGVAFGEVCQLAAAFPRVWFAVDQAFLGLSTRHAELALAPPDNVVCVRSLTKEYAIPGVRVGYLIAHPDLARRLEAARPSWTVSAYAEAAAVAVAEHPGHLADVRQRMLADCARTQKTLQAAGLSPLQTETCYVLCEVGDATRLAGALLEGHGIALRDCGSFGLARHVRLSGVCETNQPRLAHALDEVLE